MKEGLALAWHTAELAMVGLLLVNAPSLVVIALAGWSVVGFAWSNVFYWRRR